MFRIQSFQGFVVKNPWENPIKPSVKPSQKDLGSLLSRALLCARVFRAVTALDLEIFQTRHPRIVSISEVWGCGLGGRRLKF